MLHGFIGGRDLRTAYRGLPGTYLTDLRVFADVRSAFEKQKDIEYAITSVTGKDLVITKENDKVVIQFAYDKEVELMKPVYLLIKYEGRSK